uniref:PNPLA domain-containing protein n=1 Tax=viral metagenome TaxID=1070528 RepID=A0A6C0ENE0_9ZZZZ
MKYFTHLVFSGSALRSFCLLGVLRYIYFNKMEDYIKNAAGTSMGSFFCLAFALKIPIDELEEMIITLINIPEVISVSSDDFINLFTDLGFNSSKLYLSGIKKFLKKKYDIEDITFIELSKLTGVNVFVSVTKINTGKNFIFNVNDTPNVSVLDAVAASMCIPLLSQPVKIDDNYYVDGCLTNNLPYEIFNNINQDDILNVAIYIKKDYEVTDIIKTDEELNFFNYYKQICSIIYSNSLHCSYISKLPNFKNPLLISDSPFTSFYNIKVSDDSIAFNIKDDDVQNLILQGFRDISNYMKQFEIIEEVSVS